MGTWHCGSLNAENENLTNAPEPCQLLHIYLLPSEGIYAAIDTAHVIYVQSIRQRVTRRRTLQLIRRRRRQVEVHRGWRSRQVEEYVYIDWQVCMYKCMIYTCTYTCVLVCTYHSSIHMMMRWDVIGVEGCTHCRACNSKRFECNKLQKKELCRLKMARKHNYTVCQTSHLKHASQDSRLLTMINVTGHPPPITPLSHYTTNLHHC